MGFYKTFVLPVIKQRFDLDELPKTTFENINEEIEFVSNAVYTNWVDVLSLYNTNLN